MRRVQEQGFIDRAKKALKRDDSGVDRRSFLAAASAVAAGTAMAPEAFARNFNTGQPARYPDPDIVVLDKSFGAKLGNTPIERLYTGTYWAEGCAWSGVGKYVVWSDIPRSENLRYIDEDGHVSRQHRYPSNHSNGNTFDFQGRQISFCHHPAQVIRYEANGEITVLADSFGGERFNACNDGMVHPDDGSIWFTDPGYGGLMNYEGKRHNEDPRPFRKEAVYRIDGQTGEITMVTDEPFKPNGMCFSHDYTKVYIADTGASHYSGDGAKHAIWVYDVDGTTLKNGKQLCDTELDGKAGAYDGLRCDESGNIWAGAGWVGDGYDGVHIINPAGEKIGQIRLPEICGNIVFGGPKRNRLFMAASQSLYAVYVETTGAHIT
jgi:gluconolactonase